MERELVWLIQRGIEAPENLVRFQDVSQEEVVNGKAQSADWMWFDSTSSPAG